jgi:hypothetical protein
MKTNYDRTARRQLGLVTSVQLAQLGWTHHAVLHLVRSGKLAAVRHRVYRTAGSPVTAEQAVLAAVLAAGPDAVLSHASAAALWGFRRVPTVEGVEVTVESWSQPRLAGVVGHRTNSLPGHHRTRLRATPVTTAERTLIDCCGRIVPEALSGAVNDGLRRGVVTLPRLARVTDEVPRSGRRPIAPMIEVLRAKVPGYDPGDSDPEVALVESLVAAGFATPSQQVRVVFEGRTMFVDVGWPELRVGYEYDSLEFHEHRFHEDRDRLRRLKRAGWDIWPITKTTSRNEILAIATAAFAQSRAA